MNELIDIKKRLLIFEAKRWLGISEVGGNNSGQVVQLFQKSVDGLANREPWCMAFVQFCVANVDNCFEAAFAKEESVLRSRLFRSEHCLTVWDKSSNQRIASPETGSLCIWQSYKNGVPTSSGHVGIVVSVENGVFTTIEGNTSSEEIVQREGDGVFLKHRKYPSEPNSSMRIKGFLRVW